jgi:hypothetical protein
MQPEACQLQGCDRGRVEWPRGHADLNNWAGFGVPGRLDLLTKI